MNGSHSIRKRTLGSAAIAGAIAATVAGYSLQPQRATAQEPPPRMMSEDIARVDSLAKAMKEVGKAVEPSVVSINVEKQQTIARRGGGFRGLDEEMLKRLFPDQDGDGEPDVPPNLRRRFGQQQQQPNDGEDQGEASPEDTIPGPRVYGEGSGVILDAADGKAYILTNNHVAGDAAKVTVTLADGRKIEDVTVVGADPLSDLAVLEIKAEGLQAVGWGDSTALDKGDIVLAFGSPFGYVGSMTQGIVSALGRTTSVNGSVGILGPGGYENFIQTDCAINPGNSGGPLVNIHGEIVGINTAIASRSGGFNGIGFAIPSELAKFVYTQLRDTGKVERGFLGVGIRDASGLPKKQAQMLGLGANPRGAFVTELKDKTPAAGKLQPADVIVSIDGKKVATQQDVRLKISTTPPGTTVKLGVLREGKPQDVEIKIGSLPDQNTKVAGNQKPKDQAQIPPQLGVTLSDASAARLKAAGLPEDAKGALVTGVKTGSPAQMAGLNNDDLITKIGGKDITSAADAMAAMKDVQLKDGVAILARNKEGTKSVFVQIDGD